MKPKRGTAIVIVLVFATALLTFGLFYLRVISQGTTLNPLQLRKIQADFLAEGVANIAMLKYQELPSDFYSSYFIARVATTTPLVPGPLATFLGDSCLNGNSTTNPLMADVNEPSLGITFTTDFRVLSQKQYDKDAIQIISNVDIGTVMRREIRRTFYVERKRL